MGVHHRVGCAAFAALVLVAAACTLAERPARVIRVPADSATIQGAIEASRPGDTVLISAGTYAGGVEIGTEHPDITLRGADRDAVVFDGRDRDQYAIAVQANGVSLENFTAHNFVGDALTWKAVDGFAARYITVWNVGGYGLYAIASTDGLVERTLVSGAGDSGFYIGECDPCRTTLRAVEARLSAIGYSGTNASGGVVVQDSLFEHNGTGILPNSYDDESRAPQSSAVFRGNTVRGSGRVPTPATDELGGLTGIGIGVAGGLDDLVLGNAVTGSARFGIAVFSTVQPGGRTRDPSGNVVSHNEVRGSGIADLALAAQAGPGNCFFGNRLETSLPDQIERAFPCDGDGLGGKGDARVARELVLPTSLAYARSGPRPSYRSMPPPKAQPDMPQGEPDPALGAAALAGMSCWSPDRVIPVTARDPAPSILASLVPSGWLPSHRRTRGARTGSCHPSFTAERTVDDPEEPHEKMDG